VPFSIIEHKRSYADSIVEGISYADSIAYALQDSEKLCMLKAAIVIHRRSNAVKLLLLGGTQFLGPHLVEAALAQEHEVTLFNRGQHNPDLFPQLERLRGDRTGDFSELTTRHWDAVIDTSGYLSKVVRASARALAGSVERYIFISSISVYADFSKEGLDEGAEVAKLGTQTEDMNDETYGARKALCERAVEQELPGRALLIRPGLIVGPGDITDRFTYWPWRVARGGEMLAPGDPKQQTQFIDVRDLASWIIRMAESQHTGVYNATGPDYRLSMDQLLEACKKVTGSDARFIWISDEFQEEHGLNFPLYVPEAYKGARAINCQKAFAAGLTFRPKEETIRDTLAWKGEKEMKLWITLEQERETLREWKRG
jgi:2'-hydroxyisoflavone reductase